MYIIYSDKNIRFNSADYISRDYVRLLGTYRSIININ